MMTKQENWYFTFGIGQGSLAKRYVKIPGTYSEARDRMVEMFGTKFAFQYSESKKKDAIDHYNLKELVI